MGQGLGCCELAYYNQCNTNMGLSYALCCCSCWLWAPKDIELLRGNQCVRTGGCSEGYGGSCFCMASYCCPPEFLKIFSVRESIANRRGQILDVIVSDAHGPANIINQFAGQPLSNRQLNH